MYKFEPDECMLYLYNGDDLKRIQLPCYPQEVSESLASSWGEQTVIGRTGRLYAYSNTSDDSCNFSFDLHMEIYSEVLGVENYEEAFNRCVTALKSSVYPKYGQDFLKPTRTAFRFGDFKISGKVDNVSVNWKLPIIDKKYAVATVQINMSSVSTKILGSDDIYDNREAVRGLPV